MSKKVISLFFVLLFSFSVFGCMTNKHVIGNGPQQGVSDSSRQWYILWGLIPLGSVDTKEMAGGSADYQIETQTGVVDFLLNLVTGIVTVYSRSVTVTK